MNVTRLESYRQLKALRERMAELERAIDQFEGELSELGALRAKHYAVQYRAAELQREIKDGFET